MAVLDEIRQPNSRADILAPRPAEELPGKMLWINFGADFSRTLPRRCDPRERCGCCVSFRQRCVIDKSGAFPLTTRF
jgi:hypothetical protein